ncbi:aminopeptidase [Agromyces sp. SYSU T00266]|uniref:aminopeptidase n=1 Tax=Agromyces zhanjiangensis TaxID=3158562 RepID=UPI0033908924
MPSEEQLRDYARVAIEVGLGVEPGDRVLISAPVVRPEFARMVVEAAYDAGAISADVLWFDDAVDRSRFTHGSADAAGALPGSALFRLADFEAGASFLRVHAADPAKFAGVDQALVQQQNRREMEYVRPQMEAMGIGQVPWTVVGVPIPAWVSSVFPEDDAEEAEERLWQAILRAARVDTPDPVGGWRAHIADLEARAAYLDSRDYRRLRYEGPGTDLVLGMTDRARWRGGGMTTPAGKPFAPNLPTEEVFTSPHRMRAEGTVRATKPLSYFGDLIEDFSFELSEGKVVGSHAGVGEATLRAILGSDEGAVRFGEAAMVPQSGAVAAERLVWRNILYDENDACHIALGQSYASCYDGADALSPDERLEVGLNRSSVHVDFVLGSPELSVFGVFDDGSEEPIIAAGEWGFNV